MSPNASCAKSVMPTRTEPSTSPGVRTHSCSLVYFRFSGYTWTPRGKGLDGSGAVSGRLLARRELRILRPGRFPDAGDLHRLEVLDADRGEVDGLQGLHRAGR